MNQTTDTLLMIRPTDFGYNPETAASNPLQKTLSGENLQEAALVEFEAYRSKLESVGIKIIIPSQ